MARTWLEARSALFWPQKSGFWPENPFFCNGTPIFVNEAFIALGIAVVLAPSDHTQARGLDDKKFYVGFFLLSPQVGVTRCLARFD